MAISSLVIIKVDEEGYADESSNAYFMAEEKAQQANSYPPKYPEPFNSIGCGYGPLLTYVTEQCSAVSSELGLDCEYSRHSELMVTLYHYTISDYVKFVRALCVRLESVRGWITNAAEFWLTDEPQPNSLVSTISVEAAEAALAAHSQALGIEGDNATQVSQLLASLLEFCAVKNVDFDSELRELRKQIASEELMLPASRSKYKGQ